MRLLAVLCLLPTMALAELERPFALDGGAEDAAQLARAEQVIELVRATRDVPVSAYPGETWPSELRISLVVLDNGTGTDLSPNYDLYLSLFNTLPEYGIAWGLEPVISIYEFEGVERTAPGIYEITATIHDPSDAEDCYLFRARIAADARALSVAVRQAKGLEEFDYRRYTAPVPLEVTRLGCAG